MFNYFENIRSIIRFFTIFIENNNKLYNRMLSWDSRAARRVLENPNTSRPNELQRDFRRF